MSEGRPIRTEEMERLSAQLSPEARKVWLEMERLAELPQKQRQPDHRDKITELATQSMLLPDPDQEVFNGLIAEKQRALKAHAAQQKREGDALRWLAKEMQKEGLRRGMDKDERKRMTLKDFMRRGPDPTTRKPEEKHSGWSLKDYLRSRGKR
jgi:Cdc6-like AAA superfamily ATPase